MNETRSSGFPQLSRSVTPLLKSSHRMRLAAAAYVLVLAALSLLPSGTGPLEGWDASLTPSIQNALHLPAYTVLVCLVLAAVAERSRVRIGMILAAAAACVAYGALLECLQAAGIPGRTGSVSDVLWNTAGAAAGLALWSLWSKTARNRSVITRKSL